MSRAPRGPPPPPPRSFPPHAPSSPLPRAPLGTVPHTQKGVSTWHFPGGGGGVARPGAAWYYNWAGAPSGISAPAGVSFVPLIWGSGGGPTANLDQVRREGNVLLSFNEP